MGRSHPAPRPPKPPSARPSPCESVTAITSTSAEPCAVATLHHFAFVKPLPVATAHRFAFVKPRRIATAHRFAFVKPLPVATAHRFACVKPRRIATAHRFAFVKPCKVATAHGSAAGKGPQGALRAGCWAARCPSKTPAALRSVPGRDWGQPQAGQRIDERVCRGLPAGSTGRAAFLDGPLVLCADVDNQQTTHVAALPLEPLGQV